MAPQGRPWSDVPRLLRKRRQFADLGDRSLASSVTAFLAWKAFLVVARGSAAGEEKQQCISTVAEVLSQHPGLWTAAEAFGKALRALRQASPAVVTDWYCDAAWDQAKSKRHVEWALRSIREINERIAAGQRTSAEAAILADHMYAMRSAVLAHVSVQSTGNLFQHLVPPFEQLTCRVACAGYAQRAGLDLSAAESECDVD